MTAMRRKDVLNLTVAGSWPQQYLFLLVYGGPNPLGPDPEGLMKFSSLSRRIKSGPRRYRKPTCLSCTRTAHGRHGFICTLTVAWEAK